MTIRKITNVTSGLVTLADLRTPTTFVHRATVSQNRVTAAEVTETSIIKAAGRTAQPVAGISFIDRYLNNYRDVVTLLDLLGITTVKQLVDGTALLDVTDLFLQYAPQRNFADAVAAVDDLVSLILLANRSADDQIIIGQELQLFFDKYQSDVVNLLDRQRFDIAAFKSHSIDFADQTQFTIARSSQDQTQVDDRLEFANLRNLFDGAVADAKLAWLAGLDKRHSISIDSVKTFSITKLSQDLATASDQRALLLQRPLLDNNTVTDLPSLQPEPRKFELVTITDNRLGFFIGKGIRDDQGLTDLFRAFDGLTYTMTYSLRDAYAVTDVLARTFNVIRGERDGFADSQIIDQRIFKALSRPVLSADLTTQDAAVRSIGRGINDVLDFADIENFVLRMRRQDALATPDVNALTISKPRAHSVQTQDTRSLSVAVSKQHELSLSDVFATRFGFALRDTLTTPADAASNLFIKLRGDVFGMASQNRYDATKLLTELISPDRPEPPLYAAFDAPVYAGFRLLTDVITSRTNVAISTEDIADNAASQGGRLVFTGFGGERQITFAPTVSNTLVDSSWSYVFTTEFLGGVPNRSNGLEQPDNGEDLVLMYSVNGAAFTTAATLWAGAADWGSTVGTSVTLTTSVAISLADQSSVTWRISQFNYSNPGFDQYAILRAFSTGGVNNNQRMSLADVVRINDVVDPSQTPVRQVYLFDKKSLQSSKSLFDAALINELISFGQSQFIPQQDNFITITEDADLLPNFGKFSDVTMDDVRRELFLDKVLADNVPMLDLTGVFDGLVYQTIMLKTDDFTQPDFFARSFNAIRGVRDGFTDIVRPGGFLSGGGASNNNDAAISPIYLDSQGTFWGPAGGASIGSPRSIPLQAGAGAASPTFTGSTGLAVITVANSATNIVFNVAGPTTWTVPAGVSSINIEVIGGGGGGLFIGPSSNYGGGGGAYAGTRNISVTAGQTIYINVAGTQGFGSSAAVYSWINLNANTQPTTSSDGVRAPSGQNNTGVSVVYGGDSSLCIGAVVHRGGHSLFAGTGGGAAGPAGNGGNAGAGGGGGANGGTDATGTAPGLNGPRLGRSDPREVIAFNFNKDAKQSTSITISGWGTSIGRGPLDRDFIVIGDPTTVASGQSRRSGTTLENFRYTAGFNKNDIDAVDSPYGRGGFVGSPGAVAASSVPLYFYNGEYYGPSGGGGGLVGGVGYGGGGPGEPGIARAGGTGLAVIIANNTSPIVFFTSGQTSWTVTETITSITLAAYGAGGRGRVFGFGNSLTSAGGGGAYAATSGIAVTSGQTIYIDINEINTWINLTTNTAPTNTSQGVLADAGTLSDGGRVDSSIGVVVFGGGNGQIDSSGTTSAVAGGGAAGPDGPGADGVGQRGGGANGGFPGNLGGWNAPFSRYSVQVADRNRFSNFNRYSDTQTIGAGYLTQQVRFSGDLETAAFFFTTIARASTSYTITRKTIDSFGALAVSSVQVTIAPRDNDAVGVFDLFDSLIFVGRGIEDFVAIGSGIDQRQSTLERISFLITRRMGDGQSVNGAPDFTELLERPFLTLFKRAKQGLDTSTVFGNTTVNANDTDRLFIGTNVPARRVSGDVLENVSYFVDKSAKLGVVRTVAGWGTTVAGGSSSGDYVVIGDPTTVASGQSRRSGATLENFRYVASKGGIGDTLQSGRTTTSIVFTSVGTNNWTAPAGAVSVDVTCIGGGGGGGTNGGGGGGGGGLGWKNGIAITPGATYTVVVGAAGQKNAGSGVVNGGDSYFISSTLVKGGGGATAAYGFPGPANGGAGGDYVGDGGGNGGAGGNGRTTYFGGGGGGAGGRDGAGGAGGAADTYPNTDTATDGAAGSGGGGGGGGGGSYANNTTGTGGGGGGGVGFFGLDSGVGGARAVTTSSASPGGGGGGSSGTNGAGDPSHSGGVYGGGGGGGSGSSPNVNAGDAGQGAVLITVVIDRENVRKTVTQRKTDTQVVGAGYLTQPLRFSGDLETAAFTFNLPAKASTSYTITRKTVEGLTDAQSSVLVTVAPQQLDQLGVFDFYVANFSTVRNFPEAVAIGSGLGQRQSTLERVSFLITKFLGDDAAIAIDLANVFDGLVYTGTLLTRDLQVIGSGATAANNRFLGSNEIVNFDFTKSAKRSTSITVTGWGTSITGTAAGTDFIVIGDPTALPVTSTGQSRRSGATLENLRYQVNIDLKTRTSSIFVSGRGGLIAGDATGVGDLVPLYFYNNEFFGPRGGGRSYNTRAVGGGGHYTGASGGTDDGSTGLVVIYVNDVTPIVFFNAGATSWTATAGVTSISLHAYGGGAGGHRDTLLPPNTYTGGGGGAFAATSSIAVTSGQTIYVFVGNKGVNTQGGGGSGGTSGSSWANIVSNSIPANTSEGVLAAGVAGSPLSQRVLGGSAASSIGVVRFSGGNAVSSQTSTVTCGGGGAAGPDGPGANGTFVRNGGANGGLSGDDGGWNGPLISNRTFNNTAVQIFDADRRSVNYRRPLEESQAVLEELNRTLRGRRTFDDALVMQEAIGVSRLLPRFFDDTFGETDPFGYFVSLLDRGTVRMTSYADIEYFAEDYIGESRILGNFYRPPIKRDIDDLLLITDSTVVIPGRVIGFTETMGDLDPLNNINTLISRGTLRITNYVADIDYFEFDYVGESRIIS